jgi:uracil-DNA glycosylase family 4
MDSKKRTAAEAWIRYGEELGFGPHYRNRAASANSAQEPMSADDSAPESASISIAVPVPMMAAAAPHGAPASLPAVKVAPAAAVSKQMPAPPIVTPNSGPSLFEASERIEGDTLPLIREFIGDCTRCKLDKTRTNIVFGVGNPKAELMFVGEGPGHDEDLKGEPFVGRAGKLLTQMIEAMSLQRGDVYIANVVKCRPPENRLPERDEIVTCSPFLYRQIDAIRPKVICCLGACSAQTLLQTTQGISRFRGEWFDFRGSKLIATYHPAYLLRNPPAKSEVWKDLQKVMAVLGLQPKRR